MVVLFLDIDGVLITRQSAYYYRWLARDNEDNDKGWRTWCPIAANNLRELLKEVPDLKIVLSSSWRGNRTLAQCAELFDENQVDPSRCIGRTGQHQDRRGNEIQEWLDQNPHVSEFVILDDESDMLHLTPHLVKTEFVTGFTLEHKDEIVRRLAAR